VSRRSLGTTAFSSSAPPPPRPPLSPLGTTHELGTRLQRRGADPPLAAASPRPTNTAPLFLSSLPLALSLALTHAPALLSGSRRADDESTNARARTVGPRTCRRLSSVASSHPVAAALGLLPKADRSSDRRTLAARGRENRVAIRATGDAHGPTASRITYAPSRFSTTVRFERGVIVLRGGKKTGIPDVRWRRSTPKWRWRRWGWGRQWRWRWRRRRRRRQRQQQLRMRRWRFHVSLFLGFRAPAFAFLSLCLSFSIIGGPAPPPRPLVRYTFGRPSLLPRSLCVLLGPHPHPRTYSHPRTCSCVARAFTWIETDRWAGNTPRRVGG
jgi:hypothetical protein